MNQSKLAHLPLGPDTVVREHVPLSELTTMRLGGQARYVVEITTKWEIPSALEFAKSRGLPYFVLGGGANTIARDDGFPGVILLMKIRGIDIIDATEERRLVYGAAGEVWDDFVRFTVDHGMSGVECLAKIPGTVGAAPVQNIGAYGQEISEVIDHVEAYNTATGEFVVLGSGEMRMSYRSTLFNTGPDAGRYIITGAAFTLYDGDLEPLRGPLYASLESHLEKTLDPRDLESYKQVGYPPQVLYDGVAAIRGDKLPDPSDKASSGSFFKNIYFDPADAEAMGRAEATGCKIYDKPDGRKMLNTGALIEKAGLKGALLHGMRVSEKAALVLINESAKSYADLATARAEITDRIYKQFGFKIEQEPVEIKEKEK